MSGRALRSLALGLAVGVVAITLLTRRWTDALGGVIVSALLWQLARGRRGRARERGTATS